MCGTLGEKSKYWVSAVADFGVLGKLFAGIGNDLDMWY
jgi:hypothetical protein